MGTWARQESVLLTLGLDPGIPPVLIGDPNRIAQVASNFISNALKVRMVWGVRQVASKAQERCPTNTWTYHAPSLNRRLFTL
jgi:hypothetical protein